MLRLPCHRAWHFGIAVRVQIWYAVHPGSRLGGVTSLSLCYTSVWVIGEVYFTLQTLLASVKHDSCAGVKLWLRTSIWSHCLQLHACTVRVKVDSNPLLKSSPSTRPEVTSQHETDDSCLNVLVGYNCTPISSTDTSERWTS